jgi:hypothetical protein
MALVYQAVKGRQLRIPIVDSSDTTGLVIGGFTITGVISGSYSSDPVADLTLVLVEVDAINVPGYYELVVTPSEVGLTYLKLVDNDTHEIHLQVEHEGVDIIGETMRGAEGTLELIVEDSGSTAIEGALVRILTSSGSGLVARGYTDSDGEISFDLPVGSYYARLSKQGYDFSDYNPTSVAVTSWASTTPVVEELLPSEASEGDSVAVRGQFFLGDNVVALVAGDEVTPEAVSDDGTILIFVVPTDLDSPAAIKVQKDDSEGYPLTSSSLSLTIS